MLCCQATNINYEYHYWYSYTNVSLCSCAYVLVVDLNRFVHHLFYTMYALHLFSISSYPISISFPSHFHLISISFPSHLHLISISFPSLSHLCRIAFYAGMKMLLVTDTLKGTDSRPVLLFVNHFICSLFYWPCCYVLLFTKTSSFCCFCHL